MELQWIAILAKMPLFKGIGMEELKEMLQCLALAPCEFQKNEYIAITGDPMRNGAQRGIGIILTGNAVVLKENAAGDRVIMAVLQPGDMFGEMVVFAGKDRWPASVYTQEPSIITFLPSSKIIGSCEKACPVHRQLIVNLLRLISDKALLLNKKVEYLSIKSMRGKIGAFLLEQSQQTGQTTFLLPLNRNEMADFLCVSRPSMSREMGRMQAEGIIDFHRSSVRILDSERLKGMVE